ncbi:hypothetical protein F935_01957 [Acinetobacter calcoaceticus ANC 3811]|uniref:Uncharacterized protein n=1 Tax=Acinetobacter calcoaceticus ANC 3811 TaxID=1217690 RepID=R8Y1A0_ACICA|nr:hypothetical protein [Acinetobacter calcoaceticus]EOQ62866.1 hypothetical protein F935_01957 [Acinetobacter calcoaceticus ANC 3811]
MFNLLLMGLSIFFGFFLILWLIFKFIILVVKNIYAKYIFLGLSLILLLIGGGCLILENYEQRKIEKNFCLQAKNFNTDQLYERAMASYFQSYKDDIIFKKSKDKVDDNEKSDNATYNLFVLKENIRNFDDLKNAFKNQIENPYNTLNSKISVEKIGNKILDEDLVLDGISHGSVVVLTGFSKIRDNIDVNNKNLYQQLNNKNSFLLTLSSGGDANLHNFYPYNCCSIINYDNLINNKEVKHLSKQKITNYYLIVSYYRYKINTFIKDMKYIPLKEVYIESQAYPIDECGRIYFNVYLSVERLSVN